MSRTTPASSITSSTSLNLPPNPPQRRPRHIPRSLIAPQQPHLPLALLLGAPPLKLFILLNRQRTKLPSPRSRRTPLDPTAQAPLVNIAFHTPSVLSRFARIAPKALSTRSASSSPSRSRVCWGRGNIPCSISKTILRCSAVVSDDRSAKRFGRRRTS